MVDAFLAIQDEIKAIADRYADSDADMDAKRKQLELLAPGQH
jgi:putative two-component system response regulator